MNIKHCQTCGKELTPGQIAKRRHNCSNKCRIAGLNCADLNKYALKEPHTPDEFATCDAQIAAGKREEARQHLDMKSRWTPLDDSPEAERWLRDGIGVAVLEDEE